MVQTQHSQLHWEVLGSQNQQTVVMLHGWANTLETMRPFAELLATRLRVYLIDLPGFGKSAPPEAVWDSFDYADRIVALFDEEDISSAHLVGHSFGGKIAICMAARYPQRVDRLVLMATSGFRSCLSRGHRLRAFGIKAMGRCVKAYDACLGTTVFEDHIVPAFASADYRNAGPMRAILVKTINDDLVQELPKIESPTLVLWGEDDTDTPLEIAMQLEDSIPAAQLKIFPNKGHFIYEDVGAHLCAYHCLPFLSDNTLSEAK